MKQRGIYPLCIRPKDDITCDMGSLVLRAADCYSALITEILKLSRLVETLHNYPRRNAFDKLSKSAENDYHDIYLHTYIHMYVNAYIQFVCM